MNTLEEQEYVLEEAKKQLSVLEEKLKKVKEQGLIGSLAEALGNLEDVKKRITKLEALSTNQNELTTAINKLTIRIDSELTARQKMRDRENEILDKLGKYLDSWA